MSPDSAPRKFVFETVFETDGKVIPAFRPKRAFTPEEVEAIRLQAYAEGEGSAMVRAQEAQAAALGQIAHDASGALSTLAAVAHEHRSGAALLALAAARKIAEAALTAFPQAPLTAALEALAREVEAVPRLIARVAPDQADGAQAALTQAAIRPKMSRS